MVKKRKVLASAIKVATGTVAAKVGRANVYRREIGRAIKNTIVMSHHNNRVNSDIAGSAPNHGYNGTNQTPNARELKILEITKKKRTVAAKKLAANNMEKSAKTQRAIKKIKAIEKDVAKNKKTLIDYKIAKTESKLERLKNKNTYAM